MSNFLESFKKYCREHTVIVLSIVAFVLVLLAFFVFLGKGNAGSKTEASKFSDTLKNYLVSVGYNCDLASPDDNGNEKPFEYYCSYKSHTGVNKFITIDIRSNDAVGVYYTENSYGNYKFLLGGNLYLSKRDSDASNIVYYDSLNNRQYRFQSDGITLKVGEEVNCDNINTTNKNDCIAASKKVNASLREFEGFFTNAKLTLVKEK